MANLAFWAFAVVYGIFSHQVIKKTGESKDWYVSKVFDPLGKNKVFVIQQIFKISLIGFQLLFLLDLGTFISSLFSQSSTRSTLHIPQLWMPLCFKYYFNQGTGL